MKKQSKEVILMTSGAISAGIDKLNLKQRPREIKVLQATAAAGQNVLMNTYDRYFEKYEQTIAQILITYGDFFNRQRYLNLRNTLIMLLKSGIIQIINENDTVTVDEIRLDNNNNLSALVTSNLGADLLIILTNIDDLFTYDLKRSKKAKFISVVDAITPEIEYIASAGGKTSGVSGMKTKIQALRST